MKQDVAGIYRWVIDDVIAKTKPEFVSEGVEESIIMELRRRWEQRLQETGVLDDDEGNAAGPSVKPEDGQMKQEESAASIGDAVPGSTGRGIKRPRESDENPGRSGIPQQDGTADFNGPDEGADEAEADIEADDDDDEGAPSSDSDDGADEVEGEDDPNFLCALFEKVKKQKNIWKVNLKAGIFHINGREYLFSKGNGEFEFC